MRYAPPPTGGFQRSTFWVRKEIDDGRTITHVKELDSESQALELAQMLGELQMPTSSPLEIRWMLPKPE